jgi:alginate O-acetyltransferase complex protein AlgI
MARPGLEGQFLAVRSHEAAAMAIGLLGALIAATPQVRSLTDRAAAIPSARAAASLVVVALGVLAIAKALTTTFNPFLYFRF